MPDETEMEKKEEQEKRPPIPQHVVCALWALSGGRCEFRGCNLPLWKDVLTNKRLNQSNIAHIVSWTPTGPRGDKVCSPLLAKDIINLMLACPQHNHLIDSKAHEKEYPEELLLDMKREHEKRIELQTSIMQNMQSHVLSYSRPIGKFFCKPTQAEMFSAMSPYYPADTHIFDLGGTNTSLTDNEMRYWDVEVTELERKFEPIKREIAYGNIQHLSVFAFAPQPLLIKLGSLLLDLVTVEVYQKHREPSTWAWQETHNPVEYKNQPPKKQGTNVALKLSLSGNIEDERIVSVLGDDTSIWELSVTGSNNDFIQDHEHLVAFRKEMRLLYNRIKYEHGQDTVIHVFPACPVSAAVEIGRVRMPKADCRLMLYDQNKTTGGFTPIFDIE